MNLSEKDMQNLVKMYPEELLGEKLTLIGEEVTYGEFRFDLLFEDRRGEKLIVELQKGTLDRDHRYKIFDYYDRYLMEHPLELVNMIIVVNDIKASHREMLRDKGVDCKIISQKKFIEFAIEVGYFKKKDVVTINGSDKNRGSVVDIDLKELYSEVRRDSFLPGSNPGDYSGFRMWNKYKTHIWYSGDKDRNKTLYYKNGIWFGFARLGDTDTYDVYNCGINPHRVGFNRTEEDEKDKEKIRKFGMVRTKRIS